MIPLLAAVAAIAIAAFWYARREEPVRGRLVAAVLRAGAIFLLLSGWFLPPLSDPLEDGISTVALLDVSLSMSLPAAGSGTTRLDSAIALVPALEPDAVYTFGTEVARTAGTVLDSVRPEASASRAVRAIEAAALSGADSVWILTDGDLDDRAESRRAAERVDVGVREIRVGRPITRIGIQHVEHQRRVTAGDTLELFVTLVAVEGQEPLPDSIGVTLTAADGTATRARAAVPSPGRVSRTRLAADVDHAGAGPEWHRFEVGLEQDADPLAAADRRTVWVEVTPGTNGIVLVALDPDWEAGYLTPVLDRSSTDGVRAYVRIGTGRYARVGIQPGGQVSEAAVRRDVATAALLVVQARPENLPDWLAAAVRRVPAVLYLVRGTGPLAGTGVTIEQSVDGEWYVRSEFPASPLAGLFAGLPLNELPPLAPLYGTTGAGRWSPLLALRDRRGSPRPVAMAGRNDDRRWAAVLARGTWRWAARAGSSRQAYRALYAGLAGWLLEGGDPERIELLDSAPGSERRIGWRIAPGVSDLAVTLRDSVGGVIWSDRAAAPDTVLLGPVVAAGEVRFEASGESSGGRFESGRPFTVHAPLGETLPRPAEPPIELLRAGSERSPPRRRSIWPFALAAVLLVAEWIWRRRIGLR